MKIINFETLEKYKILLYIFIYCIFLYGSWHGLPIEVIPDEVGQLKNIYAMIDKKSVFLQYDTPYGMWVHLILILPTLVYWGGVYLFSFDLQNLAELKFFILNNYQDVLLFLRIFSATLFFISILLVKKMISRIVNPTQGMLFLIFISFSLVVVIMTHNSKHWIIGYSLVFFSMYLYYQYKELVKVSYFIYSCILLAIASLTTPVLILFSSYFALIHYHYHLNSHWKFFKEIIGFAIIFIIIFFVTVLGSKADGSLASNLTSHILNFKFEHLIGYLVTQATYDLFLFVFFLFGIFVLIYKKIYSYRTIFLILFPYVGNLILISNLPVFAHYYVISFVISSIFIATFFAYYLSIHYRSFFKILLTIYLLFNISLLGSWLYIITQNDTRNQTREWILNNTGGKDFIIYNTWGFNYVQLSKKGILAMKNINKNSIGSRESLHLKYNLNDGRNGLLLWKLDYSAEVALNMIKGLRDQGFNIIFINERYGDSVWFSQPAEEIFTKLLKKYKYEILEEFIPYKKNTPDANKIGDISINFGNPIYNLWYLKAPGPKITVYRFEK
jgi:hypothetical protein